MSDLPVVFDEDRALEKPGATSSSRVTALPTDRAQELPIASRWFRQQLVSKTRFGRRFHELSPDQEELLLATTILAQEREATLISRVNRDFFTVVLGAVQAVKSTLRAPLLVPSMPTERGSAKPDQATTLTVAARPTQEQPRPGLLARMLSVVNLQNLLVLLVAALLTWNGYREFQDKTIENTIEVLKANVAAYEKREQDWSSSMVEEKARADRFEDQLAKAKVDFSELQTAKSGVDAEIAALRTQAEQQQTALQQYRAQVQADTDQRVRSLNTQVSDLEAQLETIETERNNLSVQAARLQTEGAGNAKRLAGLKASSQQTRAQVSELNDTIEKKDTRITKLLSYRSAYQLSRQTLGLIADEVDGLKKPDKGLIRDEIKRLDARLKTIIKNDA